MDNSLSFRGSEGNTTGDEHAGDEERDEALDGEGLAVDPDDRNIEQEVPDCVHELLKDSGNGDGDGEEEAIGGQLEVGPPAQGDPQPSDSTGLVMRLKIGVGSSLTGTFNDSGAAGATNIELTSKRFVSSSIVRVSFTTDARRTTSSSRRQGGGEHNHGNDEPHNGGEDEDVPEDEDAAAGAAGDAPHEGGDGEASEDNPHERGTEEQELARGGEDEGFHRDHAFAQPLGTSRDHDPRDAELAVPLEGGDGGGGDESAHEARAHGS